MEQLVMAVDPIILDLCAIWELVQSSPLSLLQNLHLDAPRHGHSWE